MHQRLPQVGTDSRGPPSGRYDYGRRAVRVRAFMSQRGIVPEHRTLCALVESCSRANMIDEAICAAEDACASAPLSASAASGLVIALCRAGEVDRALWAADSASMVLNGTVDSGVLPHAPPSQSLGVHTQSMPQSTPHADVRRSNGWPLLTLHSLASLAATCARAWRSATAAAVWRQLVDTAGGCRAICSALQVRSYARKGAAVLSSRTLPLTGHFPPQAAGVTLRARSALFDATVQCHVLCGSLDEALVVFDSAKEEPGGAGKLLSPLTLSALCAACSRDTSDRYVTRALDVVSVQRSARYSEKIRERPTRTKRCHHVGVVRTP